MKDTVVVPELVQEVVQEKAPKTQMKQRSHESNAYRSQPSPRAAGATTPAGAPVAARVRGNSLAERRISELVLAEMFFVQATIESATALGDGLGALRRRFSGTPSPDGTDVRAEDFGDLLRRTGREIVEPYAERIEDLRRLFSEDRAA